MIDRGFYMFDALVRQNHLAAQKRLNRSINNFCHGFIVNRNNVNVNSNKIKNFTIVYLKSFYSQGITCGRHRDNIGLGMAQKHIQDYGLSKLCIDVACLLRILSLPNDMDNGLLKNPLETFTIQILQVFIAIAEGPNIQKTSNIVYTETRNTARGIKKILTLIIITRLLPLLKREWRVIQRSYIEFSLNIESRIGIFKFIAHGNITYTVHPIQGLKNLHFSANPALEALYIFRNWGIIQEEYKKKILKKRRLK